jgi:hypothetical protein
MQPMATAALTPKSPLIPFFAKGEFVSLPLQPLFEKEGEGEISGRNDA